MDFMFLWEPAFWLYVGLELGLDILHQSTILDLRLPLGIGILLMLFGYSFLYAFTGGGGDPVYP